MEIKKEFFFEKIENNLIKKEPQTNKEDYKIDIQNIINNEKYLKDKAIDLETEGEIIKINEFVEDNKEEDLMLKTILEDLDKNIQINIKKQEEEQKQKAIDEILSILKYPKSDSNIRDNVSPFKPLLHPKKVSMVGRVFFYSTDNNDNISTTKDNTNCSNDNI